VISQNAGRQPIIDTTRTIGFTQDVYGDESSGCPDDLRGWYVMISDPVSMLHGGPEWDEVGGPFQTRALAEAYCAEIYNQPTGGTG